MNTERHCIFVDEPHITSYAAYVKLVRKLMKIDPPVNIKTRSNCFIYQERKAAFIQAARDNNALVCFYCGRPVHLSEPNKSKGTRCTIDHYIPLSHGGNFTDPSNWRIACYACNNQKQSMPPEQFVEKALTKRQQFATLRA